MILHCTFSFNVINENKEDKPRLWEPGIIVQPINDIRKPSSVVSPLFTHDVLIKYKSFALMYSQEDLLINSSV